MMKKIFWIYIILMKKLSIEEKIAVLKKLYALEKDDDKKILILYQIKKYEELLNVKEEL